MAQETQQILLVPGLYPRGCEAIQRYAYNSFIPRWQADGYSMTVQQFGWDDCLPLKDRECALLEKIDAMSGDLHLIGASAGGIAVINAFRERQDKICRVLTVAAPLSLTEADLANFKDNPLVPIPALLREAYHQADDFLSTLGIDGLAKITSLHGRSDPRVCPRWSQRPGVESHELPTYGHARTIAGALKKHRRKVQELIT